MTNNIIDKCRSVTFTEVRKPLDYQQFGINESEVFLQLIVFWKV